ncbi:MAG: VOC family protein [Actinobacteria bacterium]|nr:VOC family protein [Actinomycetota bacterium]
MTIQRMDHVGVVVDDLEAATAFFVELGMELEGEATVEGRWVDDVVGLDDVRVEVAMVRTPDGHSRLELTKFHTPPATTAEPNAPANTLGIRRIIDRCNRDSGGRAADMDPFQFTGPLQPSHGPSRGRRRPHGGEDA